MNMEAVKWLLIIGGIILMIDALTSLEFVRDKRWFCQLVRLERLGFAILVTIIGRLL